MRLLFALLVAYVPSGSSLLKHMAARAQALGRTREVTLTGILTVAGEPTRDARLNLRFPLQCKLDGDGGLSLSVRGAPGHQNAEGTAGPALELLQMACPFLAYRGLSGSETDQVLRAALQAAGADLTAGSSLARMEDRVTWVLGAPAHDAARPQVWLYKDSSAPARVIAQNGSDLRFLQYGSPAAADWFPRIVELWNGGQEKARFEVLEAKGVRGSSEDEEDDSRE
jgi:hypothetical protein